MQQRGAITTTGYQFPNSYEPFLDYTSPIPCFYYATPPPSFCRFDPMMPKMEVASPGGSSPDASSSSRPGPSTRGVYNCYVCDDNADGFHFGAIACAACGAFFRRSIADSKTYSCSTRNCPVRFDSAKRGGICRFCRFERALSVGMLPLEVQAKRQRKSDEDMCHPSYKSPRLSSATPPAPSSVPSAPQFVGTAPAPVRHQSGSFDSSSTNAKGVLDLLVLMRREMAAERQRRCPIPCDSERRLRIFKQARFADECRLMATEFSLFRQFVLTRTPFIYMVENDAQSKEFFANFLDDSRQNEPQWHMLEKAIENVYVEIFFRIR